MRASAEKRAERAGYVLADLLHDTGTSLLCRAHRSTDQAPVLLQLPRESVPSPRTLAAYHREFEVLRSIGPDTESVAGVLALEIHEDSPLLVYQEQGLERPLLDQIQPGGLPLERFFPLVLSLVRAIESLHETGLIHNSVCCANVLADPAGQQIRLLGFNQATRLPNPRMSSRAREDSARGVLETMSPEQTGRVNRSVDHRTDLYSLGAVLYRLLSGAPPFEAVDSSGWVFAHVAVTPVPLLERRPDLPPSLAEIVAKLLEKAPENRYQTAYGLRQDLLRAQTAGEPFVLGESDHSGRLLVSEQLYGRSAEVAELRSAFGRAAAGSSELALISGYSGVGKTSLVLEILGPLVESRALFASGKFDQLRAVPYSAIRGALRDLILQLADEPQERRDEWSRKIQAQLAENLSVVTDLVPELELLVGPQPPAAEVSAADTQARFQVACRQFARALAQPAHPLVFFLDDLQWIDLASLKLLEALLEADELSHFLVIGAYRDNEVGPGHPLLEVTSGLTKTQAVTRILLSPLELEHLVSLVGDSFACPESESLPLALLLHTKTGGNPFFVRQFLRLLHLEGLLSFDLAARRWTWDLEGAAELSATENVVELMVRHLERLAPASLEVLRLAACLGDRFDLRTLATVHGGDAHQVDQLLWPALEAGLLMPTDRSREFQELGPQGTALVDLHAASIRYRFLHDRVQQGAYSMVPPAERSQLHLRIGRLLRRVLDEAELEEHLFDVVGHFEPTLERIVEPGERLAVARLFARAAQRSAASTAYAAASRYAQAGLELLGPTRWESDYELSLPLQQLLGECQGLAGDFEHAEGTLRAGVGACRSSLDRVGFLTVLMEAYVSSGQVPAALQALIDILGEFGIALDSETVRDVAAGAAAAIAAARKERSVEEIVSAEEMQDPETIALLRALGSSIDTAYMSGREWIVAVTSIAACAALEKGATASASMIFSTYGLIALEPETASGYALRYEYGQIGTLLAERFGDLAWISRSHVSNPHLYGARFRQAVQLHQRAVDAGWACGSFTWGSYADVQRACMRFVAGDALPDLAHDFEVRRVRVDQAKRVVCGVSFSLLQALVASLRGETQDRLALGANEDQAAAFQAQAMAMGPYVAAKWITYKVFLAAVFGDFQAAQAWRMSGQGVLHGHTGLACEHLYQLASALTLAGLLRKAGGEEPALLAELLKLEASYREHAELNVDYLPSFHLVSGLSSEAAGESGNALEAYNLAIDASRERRQPHLEALANERAGELSLSSGRERLGAFYFREAQAAFQAWGASAKAREFDANSQAPGAPPSLRNDGLRLGDAESLLKTSLTILGELRLGEQIQRQLELLLENVGAQRGLLLLDRSGDLVVAAESRLTSSGIQTTLGEVPLAPPTRALVEHVQRTGRAVALEDAWSDRRFGIASRPESERPRSVLCTPIFGQPSLSAVLYLDTQAGARWFTPAHRDTLHFLSALAATSLQNALFYRDLLLEIEERKRVESELRSERDFWKRVMDRIPLLIRGLKPDGTTTFLNPAAERVTGYTQEELIGKNWWRLFYPGERYRQVEELLPKLASGDGHASSERTLVDRHGKRHVISWTSTNLFDGDEHVEIVEFGTDVTEQRRMEAETAALEHQLRRTQKLETIGTLARGIAHDFNNILTPIVGLSELTLLRLKNDSVSREHLEGVIQSAFRAKGLIAQILTFSSEGLDKERRPTRLQDLLEEVLVLARASLPTTIQIRREIDPNCPAVLANPGQIHQVLLNLCTNAGHAMEETGTLTLRLGSVSGAEDRVRLVVGDTGVGMEPSVQERVFEPFFTTKKEGEGTGLGLSLVHGIVKAHDASITVESEPGKGTRFTLEFAVHGSLAAAPQARVASLPGGGRILVVDDEAAIARLARAHLQGLGYEVLSFTSSLDALEALREEPDSFLALLTDATMPELTGLSLAYEARALRPELPVVLMTGWSPFRDAEDMLQAGVREVLQKPFLISELAAVLNRVCAAQD